MHIPLRTVLIGTLLFVLAAEAQTRADERFNAMDAYVQAAMHQWQVPALSIAVVKDGQVVLVRGYGVRELGGHDPVDGATLFRLASVSKTFTATTAALLVDEGKLLWDDPVRKHLPEFELADPYMTANTTLRDLLCHRVGLETGDLLARRGDLTRTEVLGRLKYLRPTKPFRSAWKYNNMMYLAAGEVVARVSGGSWEDFVAKRLFVPLDMRSTTCSFGHIRSSNVAVPYRIHDGRHQRVTTASLVDVAAAAGCICSNAEDMAHWLAFWLSEGTYGEKRLLAAGTMREMLAMHCAIPVTAAGDASVYAAKFYGWGLGWSVLDYRGRKIHTHAGGSGTFIALVPREGIGIVVLTNLEFTNLSGMIMYDVLDAYLLPPEERWMRRNWPLWLKSDEPPEITGNKAENKLQRERKAGTSPSTDLENLAGAYRSDLYGEIEVLFHQGKLSLVLGVNPPAPLAHWQDDAFMCDSPEADAPWFDWLVTFHAAPGGAAESIDVQRIGWDEPMPAFERVKRTRQKR